MWIISSIWEIFNISGCLNQTHVWFYCAIFPTTLFANLLLFKMLPRYQWEPICSSSAHLILNWTLPSCGKMSFEAALNPSEWQFIWFLPENKKSRSTKQLCLKELLEKALTSRHSGDFFSVKKHRKRSSFWIFMSTKWSNAASKPSTINLIWAFILSIPSYYHLYPLDQHTAGDQCGYTCFYLWPFLFTLREADRLYKENVALCTLITC